MKKNQIHESSYITNKYIVLFHVGNIDDILEIVSEQN